MHILTLKCYIFLKEEDEEPFCKTYYTPVL